MKKVLSVILTLALLLMPMSVLADGPVVIADNVTITVSDGSLGDFGFTYTPEVDGVLNITSTVADSAKGATIYVEASEYDLTNGEYSANGNVLTEELPLTAGISYTLYFYGGKLNGTGDCTYSATFTPSGSAEDVATTWDTPKTLAATSTTVTVPAGETVHFSYTDWMASSSSYTVTISGTTGFDVITAEIDYDDDWNPVYNETPTADKDGSVSYDVPVMRGLQVLFAIKNNTDSTQDYSVKILAALGSYENPDTLPVGTETTLENAAYGYYYQYTATTKGTLTITMTSDIWCYYVQMADSTDYPEYHYYDDTPVVAQTSIELEAWDKVIIEVDGNWTADTVTFNASFVADHAVDYDKQLSLGKNELKPLADAKTTIYAFTPEQDGLYKFETEEGILLGYWGAGYFYVYDGTENKTNTLTYEIDSVGQSIMLGVTGNKSCTVTITRIGDKEPSIEDLEWTIYKNKVTPEKYEVTLGEKDVWTYVDVTDSVKDKAVLGADGYYHLNSADGPILFVDLANKDYMDLVDAWGYGQLRYYVKDANGQFTAKIDYCDAFMEYYNKSSVCPLTEDLMAIYQNLGNDKGWYDANVLGYYLFGDVTVDPDEAWMFACKYVKTEKAVDVKVDGLDEKDSSWTKDSKTEVVITLNSDISTFKGLYIDGKLVAPENYTVKAGSIIITLKPEYLNTLTTGDHTVSVTYYNGTVSNVNLSVATATPTPDPTPVVPEKGDAANMVVYMVVLMGAALVAVGFVAKKKFAK